MLTEPSIVGYLGVAAYLFAALSIVLVVAGLIDAADTATRRIRARRRPTPPPQEGT